MGETLITTLSMENYHPSTLLSMDSGAFTHEESERDMNGSLILTGPPDINLPLSSEARPSLLLWNEHCDILDVGLGPQLYEPEAVVHVPKVAKKYNKRVDSAWGAWLFFSFYFKPVLDEKSKSKLTRDSNGLSGYDKSDLQLDSFLVQHDMENMYMWVFKEKPENALGKMQLRSYMNGHSREGERPFPFSVDKGFVRSHRMQNLLTIPCLVISQLWILPPFNQDQFMDRMTNPKRLTPAISKGQILRPAISKGHKTKAPNKSSTELER